MNYLHNLAHPRDRKVNRNHGLSYAQAHLLAEIKLREMKEWEQKISNEYSKKYNK